MASHASLFLTLYHALRYPAEMNLDDIIIRKECSTCAGSGEELEFRGDLMAAARREAGITGSEMARRLGISPQRLQAKEVGREKFTEDQARQYLAVLNGGG